MIPLISALLAVFVIVPLVTRLFKGGAPQQGDPSNNLAQGSEAYRAAYQGQVDKLLALLKNGADVKAASEPHGSNVVHGLFFGFARGHIKDAGTLKNLLERLLDQGADINLPNRTGSTPLHLAAIAGDLPIVEMLVVRGANVNALDGAEGTPLTAAVACGHAQIVKYLLARGAKTEIKGPTGESLVDLARNRGQAGIAHILIKHSQETGVAPATISEIGGPSEERKQIPGSRTAKKVSGIRKITSWTLVLGAIVLGGAGALMIVVSILIPLSIIVKGGGLHESDFGTSLRIMGGGIAMFLVAAVVAYIGERCGGSKPTFRSRNKQSGTQKGVS